ncbi:conserved hypothetical protein [Paraburkholderia tropica]|uniref:phage tail terminator protein n=1 Tax=Paraburkholderia tropica TaxID=92647 RepID=UPI001CAFEE02|nr:hypothetical protein [Paraburkholderia tropica]CAG9195878.1 conserved hypothetical protein [Paraburkholderia tropica]
MKVTPVVLQLRTYVPFFEKRVAAAIDFDAVRDEALLPVPAAYVVPTHDDAGENQTQNTVRQDITDEFDVVVAIATTDARGQSRIDQLHDVRAMLWKALVGFEPVADWLPIQYVGGGLLLMNRERILYRFTFSTTFTLGGGDTPETWHEQYLAGLPDLKGITVSTDVIDPIVDANLLEPGQKTGPDGRIEFTIREDFNG